MPMFGVMLRGENFPLKKGIKNRNQLKGFYTTRWVEADNPFEAELAAVGLVRADEQWKRVPPQRFPAPKIFLEDLWEVNAIDSPGQGYSFYPMSDHL